MVHMLLMAGPSGGGGTQDNPILSFLPLLLIIVVMYFLLLRPQAKRQKEHRMMIDQLQKGDRVLTAGGILGTIVGIKEKENTLIVEVDKDVKVELVKSSVSQVIKKKE